MSKFITIGGNKDFIAGKAAVVEIERHTLEHVRTSSDTDDVFVILEPEDIPVLEIRCRAADIMFVRESDDAREDTEVPVFIGKSFRVSIDSRPGKGNVRLVTKFTYDAV